MTYPAASFIFWKNHGIMKPSLRKGLMFGKPQARFNSLLSIK